MTTTQPTCEERIEGALAGRLADFRGLSALSYACDRDDVAEALRENPDARRMYRELDRPAEDTAEAARERMWEYPLAVERFTVVRVELSTGGPADWFEATIDDDGTITRVEYVFQDWFDGARRDLSGPDFDAAADFIREVGGIE